MLITPKIPRLVMLLLAVDLGLAAAHALDALAGHPFDQLTAFVHLGHEGNLPTWYASMQLLLAAVVLNLLRQQQGEERPAAERWALTGLVLALLAGSIDEVVQVHEWLGRSSDALLPEGRRTGTAVGRTGLWMVVVGAPAALVMAGLLVAARRAFTRAPGAMGRFATGLLLLVLGGLVIELAANAIAPGTMADAAQVLAEELCELVGVTFMVWGGLTAMEGKESDQ